MTQRILISAHFGPADPLRLPYFEALETLLRPCGFALCLLNQSGKPLPTELEQVPLPGDLFSKEPCQGTLDEELLAAATVEDATRRFEDLEKAKAGILRYSRFFRGLLWEKRPCLCVLWNQFTGLHLAAAALCRELGVPPVFAHLGLLPGSIVFESSGQMAESWPARQSREFMDLPVEEDELDSARRYLQYVNREKLNRKPQAAAGSVAEALEPVRRAGRKVVFYAGQNDYQSGMYPPWLPGARTHSPFYTHTYDALHDLAREASRHNWHILFKPHPNLVLRGHDAGCYTGPCVDRVTVLPEANIFECVELADVTTTIVSQVSYVALMHERPVVLLGRNQLCGKRCIWEPARHEEVGSCIEQALQGGFSRSMREHWQRHVAQLLKYYLFGYDEEVRSYFGQDEVDVARYLTKKAHLPLPMHENISLGSGSNVPKPHFTLTGKLRSLLGTFTQTRASKG